MRMLITGKGHSNITAKHPTTIAFTRDAEITERGDCFAAVGCSWKADEPFLEALRSGGNVLITLECGGKSETISATGHPGLSVSEKDLVVRKSGWVNPRTLAINADKAAKELDRGLVSLLRRGLPVRITVTAKAKLK